MMFLSAVLSSFFLLLFSWLSEMTVEVAANVA